MQFEIVPKEADIKVINFSLEKSGVKKNIAEKLQIWISNLSNVIKKI